MLTAVHTVDILEEERLKPEESFTGAIAQYVALKTNGNALIKAVDDGVNANVVGVDEFKEKLLKTIKDKKILFLIDIHGAKWERDFDVELGNLNNVTLDIVSLNTLIDSFKNNGINKVVLNDPFKGGGITRYIYENSGINIVQIEINYRYRNIEDLNETKKICDALIEFISKYLNITDGRK